MTGPGKYDRWTTIVREGTGADGVVVLIFNVREGHGFSAQVPRFLAVNMPEILRKIADEVERDVNPSQQPRARPGGAA